MKLNVLMSVIGIICKGALCIFLGIRMELKPKLQHCVRCWQQKIYLMLYNYAVNKYMEDEDMSPAAMQRLVSMKKKTLVLELDAFAVIANGDQTLDDRFEKKIFMSDGSVIGIYKRPHFDHFLGTVSKWYNVIIFTDLIESDAKPIINYLDNGRGILNRRVYGYDRPKLYGFKARFLSIAHDDLSNTLILDTSSTDCLWNERNCLHINEHGIGDWDNTLLDLLPFLDAMRFVKDVRSVVERYQIYTICF